VVVAVPPSDTEPSVLVQLGMCALGETRAPDPQPGCKASRRACLARIHGLGRFERGLARAALTMTRRAAGPPRWATRGSAFPRDGLRRPRSCAGAFGPWPGAVRTARRQRPGEYFAEGWGHRGLVRRSQEPRLLSGDLRR